MQDNVSWTVAAALEKEQHPVVLNEKAGADFQLPLRAVTLSRLIDDVAEQIDLQMRIEKFMQIGIPCWVCVIKKVLLLSRYIYLAI
ncbi:MAG: hypothetical protein LBK82_02670 [Planctomycetaceae bacterium]|nr:hypothetical protein [Planctomycetaceae bacterium]